MPDKGQQISAMAQENVKLTVFLFHHRWKCTFDWKVRGLCKDTVCLKAGQKRLEDEYKDPNLLPKVKKVKMAGIIKVIDQKPEVI